MKRFVNLLSAIVRRAAALVVAITLVLTGGLVILAGQVQTATGNEGFAPDNAELKAIETLQEEFGGAAEDVVQILLRGPDVISADGLAAVEAVVAAATRSEAGDYFAERPDRPAIVSFLGGVQQVLAHQAGEADGAAPAAPERATPADPATGLDDATVERLFTDSLAQLPPEQVGFVTGLLPEGTDPAEASADAGLLIVFMDTSSLSGDAGELFDRIIALHSGLAEAVRGADLPAGFAAEAFSFPLLFSDQDSFNRELSRLFGTAFAIILAILFFVYWLKPRAALRRLGAGRRTVADVLLTMTTIVMAISWMNGFATLLGPGYLEVIGPLNEMTQIIPVLLIGLGVDYAIHLTSRYRYEVARGAAVTDGIGRAVQTVGIALVLATLTTSVGFLTNIINPVPALRDFGVLAAVGITSAFVLMLTFVPSMRLLLDRRAERAGRLPREAFATTGNRFLPELMARTAVLAERAPIPTLLVTVVLGGSLGVWGLANLETRFSTTDFVPDGSPIVATMDEIIDRFGGGFGETTEVLLTGEVATPEAHNALATGLADLAGERHVVLFGDQVAAESPLSAIATLVMPGPDGEVPAPALADQMFAMGLQPDLTVAPSTDVAALYGLVGEAAPQLAERVLAIDDTGRFTHARLSIQTSANEEGAGDLRATLLAALAPVAATGVEAVPTSNPIISHVIITALQESQLSSMLVTLLAALALLVVNFWVQYRRPMLGVLTIAPVALVVLWTFGMMAATGIPFGPVTATIAALAIGIGVPYTIHITHRFQEDRARFDTLDEAIRSTVRHTGGALAGSAFTTMTGFGVLVTSSLVPFRQFGMVTAYAIGFALLAAAIVLPSMLALWDRWHRRRDPEPGASSKQPQRAPVGV